MIDNYQHIIWDWNGTLLNDLSLSVDTMNVMLAKRRLSLLTVDRYREVLTFPIQEYYRKIGFDFRHESFEQLSLDFISNYKSRWHESKLFPETRRILELIQTSGKSQSILSAHHQDTLSEFVSTFDITHLFQHLVGLDNINAISKVEEGHRLLNMLKYKSSEVLLVGDTLHDAEVAQAVTVDCVLVAHGHQSKQRLQQSGVPVVDSLVELF